MWLEGPSVNAVPYRVFVAKGKNLVVASIVFADDKQFYLVYSHDVRNVAKDLILASEFVDKSKTKYVVFNYGRKTIKATGYLIKAPSRYAFDIFTEEVRRIISATLGVPVKVRKLKSEEELPEVSKKLSEDEKKIFELAPIDIPSDIEEELKERQAEAIELSEAESTGREEEAEDTEHEGQEEEEQEEEQEQ